MYLFSGWIIPQILKRQISLNQYQSFIHCSTCFLSFDSLLQTLLQVADFILPTSRRYGGGMVATEQNYHKITRQPYAMHIPSSSFKCACATQSRSSFKPILFAFPLYLGFNYCIWFVLHFKVGWVFSMFSFVWYWNSAIVNFLPSKERSQLCQIVCLCILLCDSLKRKLHRIPTCYVIEFASYNF